MFCLHYVQNPDKFSVDVAFMSSLKVLTDDPPTAFHYTGEPDCVWEDGYVAHACSKMVFEHFDPNDGDRCILDEAEETRMEDRKADTHGEDSNWMFRAIKKGEYFGDKMLTYSRKPHPDSWTYPDGRNVPAKTSLEECIFHRPPFVIRIGMEANDSELVDLEVYPGREQCSFNWRKTLHLFFREYRGQGSPDKPLRMRHAARQAARRVRIEKYYTETFGHKWMWEDGEEAQDYNPLYTLRLAEKEARASALGTFNDLGDSDDEDSLEHPRFTDSWSRDWMPLQSGEARTQISEGSVEDASSEDQSSSEAGSGTEDDEDESTTPDDSDASEVDLR